MTSAKTGAVPTSTTSSVLVHLSVTIALATLSVPGCGGAAPATELEAFKSSLDGSRTISSLSLEEQAALCREAVAHGHAAVSLDEYCRADAHGPQFGVTEEDYQLACTNSLARCRAEGTQELYDAYVADAIEKSCSIGRPGIPLVENPAACDVSIGDYNLCFSARLSTAKSRLLLSCEESSVSTDFTVSFSEVPECAGWTCWPEPTE